MHIFALFYALIGIPIQINLFAGFPSIFHQSLAIITIVAPVFLSALVLGKVAQKNPQIYLKSLKLKSRILFIFWILIFAFFLSFPFIWLSNYLKDATLILYSLGAFSLIIEMLAGVSLLEATLTGIDLPTIFDSKQRKFLLRITANAYFTVIANGKDLEKDILRFKSGMECINSYLKVKFKVGLLKQQDYCNFFKLIALSRNEEEKNRIREALNGFAYRLKDELDLTDTLVAISNITGKPIFQFKDITGELDFDVGIRKEISKNKNLIVFIVSLIALGFSAYQLFAPFILNTINSLNPSLPKDASMLIMGYANSKGLIL